LHPALVRDCVPGHQPFRIDGGPDQGRQHDLWRTPRKGEIVVIRDPEDHDLSIKRVIALPNQLIEIRRDGVYVDRAKLNEPYLTDDAVWASSNKRIKETRLGPKEYYVMGDNRDRSADSRIYGPVPRNFILGVIHKSQ
jgi:signal peptidase I